jgi:hypothetical protein
MDLLDIVVDEMYFERPLPAPAAALITQASDLYAEDPDAAEQRLMRAQILAADHLTVLVALYRFFFYRHRCADALDVAERCIAVAARELGIDTDWRRLDEARFGHAVQQSMPLTRFLLMALKGTGYLLLRLSRPAEARERLAKVVQFDRKDRLGAAALLRWAEDAVGRDEAATHGDKVRWIRGAAKFNSPEAESS